jgi:hypothetical protein
MTTLDEIRALSERIQLDVDRVDRAALYVKAQGEGAKLADLGSASDYTTHQAVQKQLAMYGPGTEKAKAVARYRRRQRDAARRAEAEAEG